VTNKRLTIFYHSYFGFGGKTTIEVTIDDEGYGVLDYNARRAFCSGHCHSLAIALHQLAGLTIKGVGREDEGDGPDSPAHCVVWSPKLRKYVDITGAAKRPPNHWKVLNRNLSEDRARKYLKGYLRPNVQAALPFARTIIRDLGL